MENAVNLNDKFDQFSEQWTPKIVGDLNDTHILLAKVQGEFVWHQHDDQDEMFLVIKGALTIKLPDRSVQVRAGEFFVVPKATQHCPIADEEAHIILIEPKTTKHTGETVTTRTATQYERL